jgi:hypothetical protein
MFVAKAVRGIFSGEKGRFRLATFREHWLSLLRFFVSGESINISFAQKMPEDGKNVFAKNDKN